MWREGDRYHVNLNNAETFATVYPDGSVENNRGRALSDTSMLQIMLLLMALGRRDLAAKLHQ